MKVVLRVMGADRTMQDIRAVLDDPVALPGGGNTTFGALADVRLERGRGAIQHFNYRRALTVEADIDPLVTDTVTVNRQLSEAWAEIQDRFPNTNIEQSGALDDIQLSLSLPLLFLRHHCLPYCFILFSPFHVP